MPSIRTLLVGSWLVVGLLASSCTFSPSVGPGGTPGDASGQEELRLDNAASADLDTGTWKDQSADGAADKVGDSLTDSGADASGKDSLVDSVIPDGAGLDGADLIEDEKKADTCTPACDYPACGNDDGCGGTCGCPPGYACPGAAPFVCTPDCPVLCLGQKCGKAGLAGECDCAAINGGCDDSNPCTKNLCDASGQCSNPPDNSATCEDPDPCTLGDYCDAGVCKGGSTKKQCNDGDSCTIDSCEAGVGCKNLPKCDDNDICNGVSKCTNGVCSQTAPPVVCTALDGCHSVGTCNPATGMCTNPTANEGKNCNDDSNKCNGINTCVSGNCKQTTAPVVCTPQDACHVAGTCSTTTGVCTNPVGNEGAGCDDDGNACNGVSTCKNGTCTQTTSPVVCNGGTPNAKGCCGRPGASGTIWVSIPGGTFQMGCSTGDTCGADEEPVHAVAVPAFELLEAEVTETQYVAFAGTNPSCNKNGGGGPDNPVECVTWQEAKAFCEGIGGRLPTEAEWEYSARAGGSGKFICGNDSTCLAGSAWYNENSGDRKHPVKSKASNGFGLFDMSGNVWEWTEDWSHASFSGAPTDGSAWLIPAGTLRVIRGGSFGSETSHGIRVSSRGTTELNGRAASDGFRCARSKCLPSCVARECGDDSCGGSCGTCPSGGLCNANGRCKYSGIGGTTWISIPGGTFQMGCSPNDNLCNSAENPVHEVKVPAFTMLETEVTEGQYSTVLGSNPSCKQNGASGTDMPVECVTWFDGNAFCQSIGGRLPTEAEWEYAARGGTTTRYYCGDDASCLPGIAWGPANAGNVKHPVRQKAPNAYGLYDVLGNVWEWTEDWYHASYSGAPTNGTAWVDPIGTERVRRGNGWMGDLRVSHRSDNLVPSGKEGGTGFRCACTPDCTGKTCGSNGCGGSCGTCGTGLSCSSGRCITNGFVPIPAGTFWMGSPDGTCPAGYTGTCTAEPGRSTDETLHQVTLTRAFEMQTNEVTQGEWKAAFGGWNPSSFAACGDKCPVEMVSWFDAVAFANKRSNTAALSPCYLLSAVKCVDGKDAGTSYELCLNATQKGIASATVTLADGASTPFQCAGYRLPTEAEWEYAARAGSTTAYNNGQASKAENLNCEVPFHLTEIAWYCGNNTPAGTKGVAGKAANAWALKDMSGNVWEWTWDWYGAYTSGTSTDPAGTSSGSARVERGGGWDINAKYCRSAFRGKNPPSYRDHDLVGFRLVRTLPVGVLCGGVSCPVLVGYNVACNPQSHCEYTNMDSSGWRKWDTWIWIPPGTTSLGSPSTEAGRGEDEDDTPGAGGAVYPVTFAKGYFIGRYEVVVAQYQACVTGSACTKADTTDWDGTGWGANTVANGREAHPQNGLTWKQATEFCAWVAPGGRLPSEAEWEYAAKGPVHRKYPWGDAPEPTCANNTAVFDEDGNFERPWGCNPCPTVGCSATSQVGTKPAGASWSGALDMAGNVWEWCQDWYHSSSYKGAPKDGSAWLDPIGTGRVIRGAVFYYPAKDLRSARRDFSDPTHRGAHFGARCVRNAQ